MTHRKLAHFGNCIHLTNGLVELYVTCDFGPRVIHFSLIGESNFFFTNEGMNYIQKGPDFDETFYPGAYWNIYGGNRLWRSPHDRRTVFYPDHEPVSVTLLPDGVILKCQPQIYNNVQNTVTVRLVEDKPEVKMEYSIMNTGEATKKIGCWALNVCDIGGYSIFPQPQTPLGFLPNRHITLWDYTDMQDERVLWGKKYIALRGDASVNKPIKIGINNIDGWGCYFNKGMCYVLRYQHQEGADYPDFGVSYETYANPYFLELESLSPLKELKTGESVYHSESWELFPCPDPPDSKDESAIDTFVSQYIAGGRK
jgi:hypothetical protein